MEFKPSERSQLFIDVRKIKYEKGNLNTSYKYKAFIPKSIWNKWRVDKLVKGEYKVINFGRPGYQQYRDKLGQWSKYDHLDIKRRNNYRARHEPIQINIKNKKYYSYKVPFTNEFFSYWLMW